MTDVPLGSRLCVVSRFARVEGDSQTDTKFSVAVFWSPGQVSRLSEMYAGTASQCRIEGNALCGIAEVRAYNSGEWVTAAAAIQLPPFLPPGEPVVASIVLMAHENTMADSAETELDGHFADDTWMFVLPPQ